MSIEVLLEQIRQGLSPSEGQMVVISLQQDPLVWQFIQDVEVSQPYFDTTPIDLIAFQPGRMARWLIETTEEISLDQISNLDFELPNSLKQRSAQAFETVFNTGLPPADLFTAGLLALTLRERRIRKTNWRGISDEILFKNNPSDPLKNFKIWRTPFACIFHLFSDFDEIISDFISSKSEATIKASIPLLIHAILSNPMSQSDFVTRIFSMFQNLPLNWQLESLKWLETFKRKELRKNIAKNLIQTKHNRDAFANIFSEMEALVGNSNDIDALDKQVRYTLPGDVAQLAAFYFYTGNEQKAADLYQRSSQLLEFQKAQTTYQSLAINNRQTSPAQWMRMVQSIPNSKQARFMFIHSLIKEGNYEDTIKELAKLPASFEKELLKLQIDAANKSTSDVPNNFPGALFEQSAEKSPLRSNNLVHQSKFSASKDVLQIIKDLAGPETGLAQMEGLLENNFNDLEVITLARDVYEKVQNYEKAIELTSYLERAIPGDITQKRSLARLYSVVERWQKAFFTLQELIKSESNPNTKDLERFAEAALKTDHIDMSISICQNILKDASRNTKALVLLGEGYMLKGDVVKSIQHMEQVVETIPEEPETWLTLARLWQNIGKTDRSFEILKKGAIAIPNDPALLRAIGKAHLDKKAPADALICLRKAYEIEPNDIEGKLNLAHAEYQLGQFERAWQLLKPYMDHYEHNPFAAKLLGHVLLAMEEKKAAEPILIFAAEQSPDDLDTIHTAADLILNNAESTIEDYPKAKLEHLGNILQKSAIIHQNDLRVRLYLTDIDRLMGLNQKAFDSYCKHAKEGLGEKSLLSWRIPYGLGNAALALGKHEIGLAALKDAIKKCPENLLIFHALSEAYQIANFHGRAQETAQTALRMAPQEIENILWYANFKNNCNEPEEAVKALKEALQINPERSELKLWLSKTLKVMGALEESKQVLFDLIVNSSSDPNELHQAAYVCVQLNELDLAVKALEKSNINLEESNPTLLMDLAVVYSLMDQRKKALQVLNLDVNFLRQNPQLVLLKSDLLSNLGQYDLALNTLQILDGSNETDLSGSFNETASQDQSPLLYTYDFTYKGYLYRFGQIQRALGEMHKAQEVLSKALSLIPNDIQLQNAALEGYWIGNECEKALKLGKLALNNQVDISGPDLTHLDFICSNAEILLSIGESEKAKALMSDLRNESHNYPRYHAIQSLIAANLGEFELAETYLDDAVNLYDKNPELNITKSLQDVFRQMMILNSIAEAAMTLNQNQLALKLNRLAYQKLDNQPLLNWHYVIALIKNAECQQIAETLKIVNHASGKDTLSTNNHKTCIRILKDLEKYVPNEELSCLKARTIAAFTGNLPISLSSDACMRDPEGAAAILLGCDNDNMAHDILDIYPEDPAVLQAYGVYALKNKKKDGAQIVEKALSFDTSDPIKHALLALLTIDNHEAALRSLETALEFWPDEPEWHALAADLSYKLGEKEFASTHIASAIKYQPDNANYWQRSADIKIDANDLSLAKADLEKSAAIEQNNPHIWIKMADLNRRMGNISEAVKNYETAGKLEPDNLDFATKEVKFLVEQKNYREAENKAGKILKDNFNNHPVRILLAQAQAKQGKFDQASETLAIATRKDPGNPQLLLESLKIKKEQEKIDVVLPELIHLAQEHPNHPEVLTTLTDWLIQTNRLKEAEETAQTIIRIVPEQAEVHLMLGRLQKKKGQLDQAVAHLSDAISYDPMLIEAYIELGKAYQERNDLEQAINTYQKGSQADASDPRPYFFAGMAMKECKDYAGAEKMLKQAKRYAPNDSKIIRQLGVITALNLINNLRETS